MATRTSKVFRLSRMVLQKEESHLRFLDDWEYHGCWYPSRRYRSGNGVGFRALIVATIAKWFPGRTKDGFEWWIEYILHSFPSESRRAEEDSPGKEVHQRPSPLEETADELSMEFLQQLLLFHYLLPLNAGEGIQVCYCSHGGDVGDKRNAGEMRKWIKSNKVRVYTVLWVRLEALPDSWI